MLRFWMVFAALSVASMLGFAQVPGSVVFTEVMYDDVNSTDIEWVEIHNTTAAPIDISAWVCLDAGVYPGPGTEGQLVVPAGTIIGADAYLVLCKVAIPDFTGEVLCAGTANWTLGNSGDNLALYTATTGGILIDGSLTVQYPDLAGTNLGNSIEKCNPNSTWTNDVSAWHESTNSFELTGNYRHCTPGFANSACADLVPPTIASCVALSNTSVDIHFSESVEETSAENTDNYVVNPGGIVPDLATRDNANNTLVHLTFNSPLPNNTYTVSANDVLDMFGNPAVDANCTFIINQTIAPCDVVITEIMYDDTVSTDAEWVEIHNRTNTQIDISGWVLSDDDVYPGNGGEGVIAVPAATFIAANGYAILCRVDLPGITGEIICTPVSGTWTLGNTGDNVALFTAATGGQLVDGSLSEFFPDLAFGNGGNSIEKCDYNSCWTNDPAAWTETKVSYQLVGQYRHCTPFDQGFCCPDPAAGTVTVSAFGPPSWIYTLTHVSGCVDRVIFTHFCIGTVGSVVSQAAAANWSVLAGGDGNDGDSIIFVAATPLISGSLDGFMLSHPTCAALIDWAAGSNSGNIDGPLPVEMNGFAAVAGNSEVLLNWSTASESNLDKFELRRDGSLIASLSAKNSETGSNYSYTDKNLTNGVAYSYELSAVSLEGVREVLATQSATPSVNNSVVTEFALYQNYPNPFNPETSIRFDLAEASNVTLTIYNVAGQEVETLVNSNMTAGSHSVNFSGANLTSGVYLYRLNAGSFTSTMKMVLLK